MFSRHCSLSKFSFVILVVIRTIFCSFSFAITPTLPNWTQTDIGTPGSAGSATYDSMTDLTTVDSIGVGFGSTVDEGFFVYGSLAPSESITAQLDAAPSGALGDELAGIMIRTGTNADDAYVFLAAKADGSVICQWRPDTAETAVEFPLASVSATDWFRLVVDSETVVAYYSTNGTTWNPLLGVDLPTSSGLLGGLAISSGDASYTATADFSEAIRESAAFRREITLDEDAGTATGSWNARTAATGEFLLEGDYLDDDGITKGSGDVTFTPVIPVTGTYEVFLRWSAGVDRDDYVPVDVGYAGSQVDPLSVDQTEGDGQWVYLGSYAFDKGGSNQYVTVDNTGTTDLVTVDAVKFVGTGWTDTDTDDLPDPWEIEYFGDLVSYGSGNDADSDGLTNLEELYAGTDPTVTDTDGDGIADDLELNTYGTDPLSSDSDGDGLPDGWEITNNLDPLDDQDADDDGDGDSLDNLAEYQEGTDPEEFDTDGDGLSDGAEVNTHGTDPLVADSDTDGIPDGWEVTYGLDPLDDQDADDDGDGDTLDNLAEYQAGTDPTDDDTDGDGIDDAWEVANGFDPVDPVDGGLDADGDGLTNAEEYALGTDYDDPDTDGDSFSDSLEDSIGTDPQVADSVNTSYGSLGPTGLTIHQPVKNFIN